MRRKRFWPVAAVVLVIFTVCLAIVVLRPEKGQDLGDAPPELTVVCGGRSVTGSVINYSWPEAIACGMEPLAYVDTAPALARGGEDTARLTFAVEPEQVTVNGWRLMDGQGGGCGMADVSMRLEDAGRLPLESQTGEGTGMLYSVSAQWDEEHTAEYVFLIGG